MANFDEPKSAGRSEEGLEFEVKVIYLVMLFCSLVGAHLIIDGGSR